MGTSTPRALRPSRRRQPADSAGETAAPRDLVLHTVSHRALQSAKNSSSRSKPTAWRERLLSRLGGDGKERELFAKERRYPVAPSVGFDKAVIPQHGDPGIPMAAVGFLPRAAASSSASVCASPWGGGCAHHLGRRRRKTVAPHRQPLGWRRRRRRHLASRF